ncbi:hypothetical protein [Flavobacterium inviolabile]|uniref:hypothetical protein n=1 Tax=Flavobacterium inviolabile TaxID=2748320 RepID=UPI0015AE09CC|nr:hypothetical protein [Flavobacterium inviolabile]
MPRITRITPQASNPDRVSVFIDGEFCTGIRARTFQAMGLTVGSEITCAQLKENESFFWKKAYGEDAWEKEKVRLNKIKDIIESIDDRLQVKIVGFGADSNKIIKEHAEEKGVPDLDVVLKSNPSEVIMKVEVTGTEVMRGEDYWVRPDKLEYSENHPEQNVWTALHYAKPNELVRFLKHTEGKKYETVTKEIKGADEIYSVFNDGDDEVFDFDSFKEEVKKILDKKD